jgi:hypothetical protein
VLLTPSRTASSYGLLIDAIGSLGPPTVHLASLRGSGSSKHDIQGHRELLARALRRFAGVFKPSCWTAYFCNQRLSRAYFLDAEGVRHPEALYGFRWSCDLPTRLLLDDGSAFLGAVTGVDFQAPEADPFREREGISPANVLKVRLTWGTSRVILIMNWRDSDLAKTMTRGGSSRQPRIDPQPAALAARYLLGWLNASGLEVTEENEGDERINPGQLIQEIAAAAKNRTSSSGSQGDLVGLVDRALNVNRRRDGQPWTSLHWTNADEMDIGGVKYPPRSVLMFQKGEYIGFDRPPAVPLKLNATGLVSRSVNALATCWDTSVLIEDLDAHTADGRIWRDISIQRRGFDSVSEIAIPFRDEQGPLGVVNVESEEPILPYQLRRAELVVHLFARLHSFFRTTPASRPCRAAVEEWTRGRSAPMDAADLLKRYCDKARELCCADLVNVVIYDARASNFVPVALSLDSAAGQEFLRDEHRLLGFPSSERNKLLACYTEHPDVVHVLLEHLLARRMHPRIKKRTWRIFSTGEPYFDPNTRTSERESEIIQQYAPVLFGFSFRHHVTAVPDGVVWMSWNGKLPKGMPRDSLGSQSTMEFAKKLEDTLRPLTEVAAAMFMLFRYFDPEGAVNPAPLAARKVLQKRSAPSDGLVRHQPSTGAFRSGKFKQQDETNMQNPLEAPPA